MQLAKVQKELCFSLQQVAWSPDLTDLPGPVHHKPAQCMSPGDADIKLMACGKVLWLLWAG